MFRSSTIIRELALNLAKFIFTLKHPLKLRHYLLCGCLAACCLNASITLAMFGVSSLMMAEDRNM
jgi:hypothetical protein